jgi:peptide/nickel transport system substrate-binding protein
MSRRFIVVIFALFLAFAWSLAPGIPLASAEDGPLGGLYGGDFVVAVKQETIFELNPNASPDETSQHIIDLLYDSLARIDPETLLPIPWVASGWTIDEENETVLVQLRDDVTWHDGVPVTADDVVNTYSEYPVTKVSNEEIRFNLAGRNDNGRFLAEGLTLPLTRSGVSDPIGCGPFKFVSENNTEVVIEAHEDYFDGRPYLDTIAFRKYPGFDEVADAMLNGEAGFVGWPLNVTENSVFLQAENSTIVSIMVSPSLEFLYVGMNTQLNPLNDSIMRKAIAMSTDKDLHLTIEANTIIADSVINPANSYWLNTSVPRYRVKSKVEGGESKPDLDAVKIMLDEAGYTDQDSDGLRELPNGSDFYFEFYYPSTSIEVQKNTIAADLIGKLQVVGLDVRDKIMNTWDDLYSNVTTVDFGLFLGVLEAKRDPGFIGDVLHSTASGNLVNYDVAAFDELLDDASAEIRMIERRGLVMQAQGWIAEENPLVPILHYKVLEAVNKTKFTGWVSMVDGIYNFWSFNNLHLTQGDPPRVSMIILADQVDSSEEIEIEVEVKHPTTFDPMPGIFVNVTESLESGVSYSGYTDDDGSFAFSWQAPVVTGPETAVFTARTSTPGYPEAQAIGEIAVHPGSRVLLISVSRNPPIISSDDTSWINITVRDYQTQQLVEGAEVNIRITPEALESNLSNPSGVTDASGIFRTTFTASVPVDTKFIVVVEISKTGYADEDYSTSIFVDRTGGSAPGIPALDTVSMMLAVVLLTLGYAYWRRRGPKRR